VVFTISPADAQAIQEDEVQLLMAIAQAARGVAISLHTSNHQDVQSSEQPGKEGLRIQMGRRLVYGQLARGEFRHELTADSIHAIVNAMQRPVTEEIDAEAYHNKVPAIEIREGDRVLFREERDGAVTANQIQLQIDEPEREQLKIQSTPLSQRDHYLDDWVTSPTDSQPSFQPLEWNTEEHLIPSQTLVQSNGHQPTENVATVQARDDQSLKWDATDIAQAAEYLLNPLGSPTPIYESVSVGGYGIKVESNRLTVSRDNNPILVTEAGAMIFNQLTQQDYEFFQRIQQEPLKDSHLSTLNGVNGNSINGHRVGINQQTEVPPAIAVAQRQVAKLPDGATKDLLEHTTRHWAQQFLERAQSAITQGVSWLVSRPEVWRNTQVAYASLNLFDRGYERTGEHAYQAGAYSIQFKGRNLYILRDENRELMRFQVTSSPIPGMIHKRIQLKSVSPHLTHFQRKEIVSMKQDELLMPQGSQDIEADYAAKVNRVEQTVTRFLKDHVKASGWDRDGGSYKFEMPNDTSLRITDKQSKRGIVFRRLKGKVFSRLNVGDFAHFERLHSRMQSMREPSQRVNRQSQNSKTGIELS
jgi:hypothetical protein